MTPEMASASGWPTGWSSRSSGLCDPVARLGAVMSRDMCQSGGVVGEQAERERFLLVLRDGVGFGVAHRLVEPLLRIV